ncbi:phosphate ABC transporter permease PstA [Luteolibacter algae]|uniref:Phosphate transport system permease protein PstA n=1 Tax=Luteolibacter algae TaxID=454151 RepID=A0ABW5D639_9BACT
MAIPSNTNKHFATTGRSRRGEPLVWLTAAGLAIGVVMALGLFFLILVKGAASFWPRDIELFGVKKADGGTELISGYVTQTRSRKGSDDKLIEEVQIFRGNKDLSGETFVYVDSSDILSREIQENVLLLERLTYGPAIGTAVAMEVDGKRIEAGDPNFSEQLETMLSESAETREKVLHIERKEIGKISMAMEKISLGERSGRIPADQAAEQRAELQAEFDKLKSEAEKLDEKMAASSLVYTVADGREKTLPASQLLDVFAPNQAGFFGRLGESLHRVWKFLKEDPREANTEGGVFPAIFGTVVMTLVMSLFVTPFGVIAAIYLREYAKQGMMVRIVRICVNNLAGVPSIVFGVFGLAFFVYFVGAGVDKAFFAEKLPTPTFGTPGILWASLTLALLTLPVVIVATEEALSAVPRGVREAALACGASKWQAIQRVVLPASLPGILTGVILAMARGAGEVAPLMLVGVVKLAPSLPIDDVAPFIHAERKFMHLGFHIYDLGFQSPDAEAAKPFVYATALLLIVVVVTLNLAAIMIRNRLKKRFAVSSF